MIERHITFAVLDGQADAFERFFADTYRPAAAETPGFIELRLLHALEKPLEYQMVFRWETPDAAVAWRTSPVHEGLQPALKELHQGMEIVAYTVVA